MVKIYFLGGEDVNKRKAKEINIKAFDDAGENPIILIFPWTSESKEKIDKYKRILTGYFEYLAAEEVKFANITDSIQTLNQKINSADLIYLPGGLPKILMKYAKKRNLAKLLQKYNKVIIGNSAGALVLCKDCVITKDKYHPKTEVIPGLGLVDFSVEVHYDPSKDEQLKRLSEDRKIYAIPERCAVVYDGKNLEFIGLIHLFYNGNKIKMD